MKLIDIFEQEEQKGSYAAVRFSEKTKDNIADYIKKNKIPNAISPNKLHTTLLYSKKFLPDYTPKGKYDKQMVGKPGNFDVWKSNNADGDQTNCLIVEYKCKELDERHTYLMDKHKATYDYPKYKTHITLSYDIGDMDIKDLPPINFDIEIVSEYGEELDLNWAKNKGTSK